MTNTPALTRPLDGALYCASKGLRVFPLRPGSKVPLLDGWQDWATTERWQIEKFAASNTDCNWAIYCGGSGVFAIDLDEKDGRHGISEWERLAGANPTRDTLTVKTPTGGVHLIYRGLGKNTASSLAPGIDTRGQGGYIVAPGSILLDKDSGDELGRYVVIKDLPIEPVPEWVAAKAGARKDPLQRPEGSEIVDSIPDGMRDNTLARWAGHLKATGLEEEEIYAALSKMNDIRCSPPLEDHDVRRIARSIGALPRKTAEAIKAFSTESTPVAPLKSFSLAAIKDRQIPDPEQVIEDFADVGDTLGIFGKSKAKKSWALLQLGIALAIGRDFAGIPITKPRRTLLVQLEVTRDHFERRAQRVLGAFGAIEDAPIDNLRIAHGRGQGFSIESIAAMVEAERPECLLIDPLYPLITEENAAEGVKPVIEALSKAAETGVFVAYTHHDKKGKSGDLELVDRGSGSGVIGRAYDAAVFIDSNANDPEAQVFRFITRNYPPLEDASVKWADYLFRPHHEAPEVETSGTAKQKSYGPGVEEIQAKVEEHFKGQDEIATKDLRVFLNEEGVGARKRIAVIDRLTTPPYGSWQVAKSGRSNAGKCLRKVESLL